MRLLYPILALAPLVAAPPAVTDSSPLIEKARYFQRDLIDKHLVDGLYISIVPVAPPGTLRHTVDEPGNVIHAGVWTGRYLAGAGYQYAATKDPWVRKHGGELLQGLRRLQEITGKPGLLARGYVRGHGPVEDWEREGRDSREWHQGQGRHAGYRWYGDVSVDNFNAVLYGYAVYYDLAADAGQKKTIAFDVDRLMTHLLDNHCRIVDVDDEVTLYGHVGFDPDAARDDYYKKFTGARMARYKVEEPARLPLRASVLLLPDLLIAHHITGRPRYLDLYRRVVARYRSNPDLARDTRPFSPERVARVDHSSEGQTYEALYNLIRYERDPGLLSLYRQWTGDLWEMNWMEGNSLYTFMTLAMLETGQTPRRDEALRLALESLFKFPVDRVFRPVMNSPRAGIERNPHAVGAPLALRPLPIQERPLDNEYEWKGNPYRLDGWLKPAVTAFQASCDDPLVAWFADSAGRLFMTRDGWKTWHNAGSGLMGAPVRNIAASDKRTFVLWARTGQGVFLTRDGGMSWRPAPAGEQPAFSTPDFSKGVAGPGGRTFRISEAGELETASGATAMKGWRIPRASAVFATPRGVVASGPGGAYLTPDGENWQELKLWREEETGAADFLHAYWMGRYYGWIAEKQQ
jgi:hypothetical protein